MIVFSVAGAVFHHDHRLDIPYQMKSFPGGSDKRHKIKVVFNILIRISKSYRYNLYPDTVIFKFTTVKTWLTVIVHI